MPCRSSGLVVGLARMTASPAWARRSASSESRDDDADADAGRGGLAGGQTQAPCSADGTDVGRKQNAHLIGRDAPERCVLVDQPFAHEIDRDAGCGVRGELGGARLQKVELSALDGELDVLNVAPRALERLAPPQEALRAPRAVPSRARTTAPA